MVSRKKVDGNTHRIDACNDGLGGVRLFANGAMSIARLVETRDGIRIEKVTKDYNSIDMCLL